MDKTYAELLDEVSIKVTPNDAIFLGVLVSQYMAKGNDTEHLHKLLAQLMKAGA